jgi:hypothetical protein
VACDAPQADQCVTLLCLGEACGVYRCEDLPGEVELARFPPSRPPAAAAAPGSGPRRNRGGAQSLPRGLFRLGHFATMNIGTERFMEAVRRLELEGILFRELPTR